MAPLNEWLKAKLGKKKSSPSPPLKAPITRPISPALAAPNPAAPLPTLLERLWNQAYDQAKASDAKTADTYELILSARLSQPNGDPTDSTDLASQRNEIEHNPEKRGEYMHKLIQIGLCRTEKEAKVKQGMEDAMQAAKAVKDIVDKAIQASPEAALAWVGVCFALEILMNPSTQAISNREGIAYVISRTDWYWNLSSLLLAENVDGAGSQGLRNQLEKHITHLYAKLLLYQMKSVCCYNRRRLSTVMRDLIKLDNWDGNLKDIKDAEAAVQRDSEEYNTTLIKSHLGSMVESAKLQYGKFDNIISAIREGNEQQERMRQTDAYKKCLADLHNTNPRDDKTRIEDTKGGLLKDSYLWILEDTDFQQWRNDPQSRLLWIKADPGKGKTMLLCGIINELEELKSKTDILSYFFCQAPNPDINSATAVLRGLVYMLVCQQPSLISHIQNRYDDTGTSLFKGENAWFALSEIFTNILQDPSLNSTYLIIDALDECVVDLKKLLKFVAEKSNISSRVKWIVSSRNWPQIEDGLKQAGYKVRLSLELNAASVSTAVQAFIDRNVSKLAVLKGYDTKIEKTVRKHLESNANNTFLWVALVCNYLQDIPRPDVLEALTLFPPGLDALYERMMQQIGKTNKPERCKQVLAVVALVYRPITLDELVTLVERLEGITEDSDLQEIIGFCGSFLTVRERTVYFVHQSAKDFLLTKAAQEIFPAGREAAHQAIFARSLQIMSAKLRRDMYSLKALGLTIDDVEIPKPDPLAALCYSCVYWVDHLCDFNSSCSATNSEHLGDGGVIDRFLREKCLYWLEALSLCKHISKGVVSIGKLQTLVQVQRDTTPFTQLVYDVYRFILYNKQVIENSPLQAYGSALLFSPNHSLVRKLFQHEEPREIIHKPAMSDEWSACLQTFEGHSDGVSSVAFSPDSTWLASASLDSTIKMWDVSSGACMQTLEGHSGWVLSVAFSPDSTQLATASQDRTIKIWDVSSGVSLRTLEGHSDDVTSVAFSPDSTLLATASNDRTVKIWDVSSSACLQTLEGHSHCATSVAFSRDSTQLASTSYDRTVKMWDVSSGACLQTFEGHSRYVTSVAFSPDSTRLASASDDETVKIWDVSSGACLQTLEGHSHSVTSVAFPSDSTRLASASQDRTIKIWDISRGICLQTLEGHSHFVTSVTFSSNSTRLASASKDSTFKIWDASSGAHLQTLESHSDTVVSVAFSPDSTRLASTSKDNAFKIWDASSGACLQTLEGHSDWVTSVAFSPDLTRLASASEDSTVKIWDASSGACLQTLENHSRHVTSVAFSPDSTRLASASWDMTVKMWDASSGACLQTLKGHSHWTNLVAFSTDSMRLASASWDCTIKIWDANSGACLQTLEGHSGLINSVAFSHDSKRLASASDDDTVKIWDANSGACLQTLDVGKSFYSLLFDATGSYILTEIGSMDVSSSMVSDAKNVTELAHRRKHVDIGVSLDNTWVTCSGKKLVWIPSEYRPTCSSVCGNTIGIGTRSGRVWFVVFTSAMS